MGASLKKFIGERNIRRKGEAKAETEAKAKAKANVEAKVETLIGRG